MFLVFCFLFFTTFLHSYVILASGRKGVAWEHPANSWDTLTASSFKTPPWKCFGQYSLTTCGRVFTKASTVSVLQLRSKRRPPCYSGSQTAAGNQEKCVQATELVRPEAAMISDRSAARDEQIYAFISGLSPRHRSCTRKKPHVSVFVKIVIKLL